MPMIWVRVGFSPSQMAEPSATTIGCTFTSTTLAATEVMPIETIQLQRCMARNAPAPNAARRSGRESPRYCFHVPVATATVPTTARVRPMRHTAIARGSACERRTSGPEMEMPRTAAVSASGMSAWVLPDAVGGNSAIGLRSGFSGRRIRSPLPA